MRLNELQPAIGSKKNNVRLGRGIGSGMGKTCGKGHKGQKARSGASLKPGFEGGQMPLQRRMPKFGFRSRVGFSTTEIRLEQLNKVDATVIDLLALREANLIQANIKRVKIMLKGSINKAINVKGIGVTKGAKAAIEAAGGKVEE